jgi:GNAT superfamily N-acetyltransferase
VTMAAFSAISAKDIPGLQDALDIYADSFPANQRHPAEVIRERVAAERYTLMVGRREGEVVFFALLWPLRGSEFVLLDYMATKKTHRGEGIGAAFLKSVSRMAALEGKFLLMEVEDPTRGGNREERARRAQFYRRQGAKELQGVRYLMPGLSGGPPTEMILMVLPPRSEAEMDGTIVRQVVMQIYKELYSRDGEDGLLNSFIGEIGAGSIKLSG